MKKLSALVSIILAVSLMLAGCSSNSNGSSSNLSSNGSSSSSSSSSSNKAPIKIGVIEPRSGSLAVSGEDSYWGTQIAIDMINDAGGIDGRKVEAVVADCPDQNATQTEVNRLIQQEGVKVITGIYGSAFSDVAGGISDRNDVLYWEAISVSDKLTQQNRKNYFRVTINGTNDGQQAAEIAANYAKNIGVNVKGMRLAIVSENGDFGQSIAKGVEEYAKNAGMNIVLNESYDSKTTDTSPIVLKMKNANPDVVIATSYINDGIDITKQSKILNFRPKLFLGIGSGYGLAQYGKSLGQDAEGIIDVDPTASPLLDKLDPKMKAAVEDFQKRYQAKRGYMPPTVGYETWQATWVLLNNVIAPAGGTDDVSALRKNAMALDLPVGSLPTGAGVKFDENGQNTKAIVSGMQWQNGKLVTIYPDIIATAKPEMIPLPPWNK